MNAILDVNLPEYFGKSVLHEYFEDQLVVVDLDDSQVNPQEKADGFPMRLKASLLFLILSGEMDIEVNYQRHHLKQHMIMHLIANDIILDISHSSGFNGYLVIFSPELRSEIMGMTTGLRLPGAGQLKRAYPILEFEEMEFRRIAEYIRRIKSYIFDETHLYRSPMIRNEVMNLLWDIDNSRWKKHGNAEVNFSHSELLREKFREMLVEQCRRHRDVGFYARELCVTPDYLSRVIREHDDSSAIKWIANAVVAEAKCLMRQPGKTINEIAMEMNFPDQSTFGKFFKKHTGVSPKGYKRGLEQRFPCDSNNIQ